MGVKRFTHLQCLAITLLILLSCVSCSSSEEAVSIPKENPTPEHRTPTVGGVKPTFVSSMPVLQTPTAPEATTWISNPYCNPEGTGLWLVPSSTFLEEGEALEVALFLENAEDSVGFMGQVQYRLEIAPKLMEGDLGPMVSTKTLYPGDLEMVTFQLRAVETGQAQMRGLASYELHALDMSWGSWTGCATFPVDIEVVSSDGGPSLQDQMPAIHAPSTRTGVAEINVVLDAVLARDQEAVKALVRYTLSACTHADGLGGPPKCREGEADGTRLEVLPFLGPEGHFLRREEVEAWSGLQIKGLIAVYRVSEEAYSDPDYPAGEYAAVFLHGHGVSYITLQIEDGYIVRIDNDFGYPPEDRLLKDAAEILLHPPRD
ncbi:MAG: hypothetical protein GTO14_03895 [Anaerolineales bacterium]|nr:hypothetical protein [Anaerolineales bacterium]